MPGFLSILGRALDLAGALFFFVMGAAGMIEWPFLWAAALSNDDRHLLVGMLLVEVVFTAVGAFWLRDWRSAPKLRNVEKAQ
jgi:hypothetical protein